LAKAMLANEIHDGGQVKAIWDNERHKVTFDQVAKQEGAQLQTNDTAHQVTEKGQAK